MIPGKYDLRQCDLPLGTLKAADYNPRVMPASEREALIRSIETFGFVEPVVARAEDSLLIGGHQRVDALRELLRRRGLTPDEVAEFPVPVTAVAGLSDDETRVLNLALNKISGTWDHSKLAEMLDGLSLRLETPVLELTGFTVPQIADYRAMMSSVRTPTGGGGGAPSVFGGKGGGGGGAGKLDGPAEGSDPAAEWTGMPEFNQPDKTAFRSIVMHFHDQAGVDAFARAIGKQGEVTEKTRYIWFPEIVIERLADKAYVTAEADPDRA